MLTVATLFDGGHRTVVVDVTSAGAITQFTHGVLPLWVLVLFMRIRSVIIGVTAGAIGLVPGLRPGNHLIVRCVATGATQVGTVVTGITAPGVPII